MSEHAEQSVSIHLASAAPGVLPSSPPSGAVRVVPMTVVLETSEPVKQLWGHDPKLSYVILQALDNDIVIAKTKGDAQAAANVTDTSLKNPVGAVIPTGVVVPIKGTSGMWAAAATYPTRVSVIIGYCA